MLSPYGIRSLYKLLSGITAVCFKSQYIGFLYNYWNKMENFIFHLKNMSIYVAFKILLRSNWVRKLKNTVEIYKLKRNKIGHSMIRKEWTDVFHIWREDSVRHNNWLPEAGWCGAKKEGVKYHGSFKVWISRILEDLKCQKIVLNFPWFPFGRIHLKQFGDMSQLGLPNYLTIYLVRLIEVLRYFSS